LPTKISLENSKESLGLAYLNPT